jgi:4-amino-4-deoxy-L-arabinose transferase-like glycosyltransferase
MKKLPLLLLIIGLYLLLSLYRLGDVPPPWYDEIAHLNTAVHVAGEGRIWCDFYSNKFKEGTLFNSMPLQWLLLAAFIKVFGLSLFGARLFYVVLSVFTLYFLYLLCRKLFDENTAGWAVALLAASYIFFHNSRQLIPQVPASMFSMMSLVLFCNARDKRRSLVLAASGVAAGLAYLSHPLGLVALLSIAIILFLNKATWRHISYFFLGA